MLESDDVGVECVKLLVDGATVTSTPGTGALVSFDWKTTIANGTHTLQLRARDEVSATRQGMSSSDRRRRDQARSG